MKRTFSVFLFTVIFASSAQAGNLRINWSCSDILNFVYNNERIAIGNEIVSLRSCSGQTVTIHDQVNQKCVNVNLCDQAPAAPQPPRREENRNHHPHSGGSSGGYYSDGTYDGRAHHYESDRYNNSNNGGA